MYNTLDYNNGDIGIISQSVAKITVINFENINDYYCKGYFVFYNDYNELSCAFILILQVFHILKKNIIT